MKMALEQSEPQTSRRICRSIRPAKVVNSDYCDKPTGVTVLPLPQTSVCYSATGVGMGRYDAVTSHHTLLMFKTPQFCVE